MTLFNTPMAIYPIAGVATFPCDDTDVTITPQLQRIALLNGIKRIALGNGRVIPSPCKTISPSPWLIILLKTSIWQLHRCPNSQENRSMAVPLL